jgi:fatty-acyl-CoA synthase
MFVPATNLDELLRVLAHVHRDRLAVAGETGALTFSELDRAADRWAAALLTAGFGPSAHVALLAGNGPDWLAVAFGAWRAGATLVPVSTFVTARELAEALAHADADVLVVQPRLRTHDYLESLRRSPRSTKLQAVVALGDEATPPYRNAVDFLDAAAGDLHPHRPAIDAESIACILYTSGTTGQPKGVMLSHRAILATAAPTAERTGLGPKDRLLSTLPLFWVAGLVIRALPTLVTGCALLLVETFTVEAALAALRRHRPSALHLRPPQVSQLLAHPDFRPDLLAHVHRGGGRADWFGDALGSDARLITGYGMTEMAGYVTAVDWRDSAEARRMQIGAPLPGVEIRIVDPSGRPCACGEVGEIRTRGPGMFSGYYKQPAGTSVDGEGFFLTGDLGRVDASGTFHFVGRSKDLLRSKGINVSPLEVEAILGAHPAVAAAYVVGLPPDGLEQSLVALIVPKSDVAEARLEHELRVLATGELSHYKRPEQYLFIRRFELPRGGTSKPQRAALAELAAKRRERR